MKKLNLFLALCITFAAHAQVPVRWVVESARAAPAQISCYRGETLLLQPTIKAYGETLSNYTASVWWQTNGMGSSWWSTNALVFSPEMDVGASAYTLFIQADTTNGKSYRANAVIRMLSAPGATPNALPLPVQRIDFSAVSTINAPWLLVEEDPLLPSAIAAAAADAQEKADAARDISFSFSRTNPVTRLSGTSDEWVSVVNGTATTFRVTYPFNGLRVEGFGNPSVDGMSPPSNVYYTPLSGSRKIDMGNHFWCGLLDFNMGIGWLGDEYSIDAWAGGAFAPTTLQPIHPAATGYWEVTVVNLYPVTNRYPMVTSDMSLGLNGSQVSNIVVSIVRTNQLWASPETNALYRMSWDATNGTFKIEEIFQ